MDNTLDDGTPREIVFVPLGFACFILVYGIRGLRLIVLYNSDMRRRWGGVLNEAAMAKYLVALYVTIEVIAWSACAVYGVERYAPCPN